MNFIVAKTYKVCGRCAKQVRTKRDIADDGHGRGVCFTCLYELQQKREQKALAAKFIRCLECKTLKPAKHFQHSKLQIHRPAVVNGFTKQIEVHAEGICQTCEVIYTQECVAIEAERFLKTRAIMSLVSGTRLRKNHLPDELIQTKIAQMKVSKLWQSPRI